MENVLTNSEVINAIVDVMSPFGEEFNKLVLFVLTTCAMSCLPNILLQFIGMMNEIFLGIYDLVESYVKMVIVVLGVIWYFATMPEKIMIVIMIINIILVVKILQKLFHLIKGDYRL